MTCELAKIVGLKVLSIRGFSSDKKKKHIEPQYILFDDGKTLIELSEQDYYSYHDCSSSARHVSLYCDEKRWDDIFNDTICYPIANMDI